MFWKFVGSEKSQILTRCVDISDPCELRQKSKIITTKTPDPKFFCFSFLRLKIGLAEKVFTDSKRKCTRTTRIVVKPIRFARNLKCTINIDTILSGINICLVITRILFRSNTRLAGTSLSGTRRTRKINIYTFQSFLSDTSM